MTKGSRLVLVILFLAMFSGASAARVRAALPPPTGYLEICKVLAVGTTAPAGTLFTFAVAGLSTFSVTPGTCTLQSVSVGNVQVQETGPAGYTVSAITFPAGTGTPNVAAGNATAVILQNRFTFVQFTDR